MCLCRFRSCNKGKVGTIVVLAILSLSILTSVQFVVGASPHGYISISFDDGFQSEYDYAYPLLHQRGIDATYYIIASKVGASSYMTSSELVNLQSTGSEIGSHSNTHPDFTSLTDSQAQQEMQLSKQTLQSYGLTINNFAYPYGSRNSHTDQIAAQYYRSARSAYAPPFLVQVPYSNFLIPGCPGETGDSTALSALKNQVDQVYSTGSWEVIFFHQVVPDPSGNPYAISTSDFASFLDYVLSKGIVTLTVNQGLNLGQSAPSYPSVDIDSPSATLNLGQSVTFSSSVSGGQSPYTYQWYVNDAAVASSNNPSFVFTPAQTGSYSIYLQVTDMSGNIGKSNVVHLQVINRQNVEVTTNVGSVSPQSGDYDVGSSLSLSATSPQVSPSLSAVERYVWKGWVGSGSGSYTGMNNPATVRVNAPVTESAQWEHQYLITFSVSGLESDSVGSVATISGSPKLFGDFPFSIWVDSGDIVSFSYSNIVSTASSDVRYVLSDVNALSPLSVSGPISISGSFKTQYYLAVASPYSKSSGSGWYDSGSMVYAGLSDRVALAGAGKRFVFSGWSTDASGTGYARSNPIVMDSPKIANAVWKTQYYLNVYTAVPDSSVAPSSGWFDAGTTITSSVNSTIADSIGVQYISKGWSGNGSAVPSGTASSASFAINSPSAITWNWQKQYYLTVNTKYGFSSGSGWYNAGANALAAINPTTCEDSSGTSFAFAYWSGDASGNNSISDKIIMDAPKVATANWIIDNQTVTPSLTPIPTPNPPTPTPTVEPSATPSPPVTPTPTPSATFNPTTTPSSTLNPTQTAKPTPVAELSAHVTPELSGYVLLVFAAIITCVVILSKNRAFDRKKANR